MKLTFGQSCLLVVVAALVIAGFQTAVQSIGGIILMLLLIAGVVAFFIIANRNKSDELYKQLVHQCELLDQFAQGTLTFDASYMSTQKDEVLIYKLDKVLLKEFKSTGSTYSGGYGGLSFRVAKGVRANVGGMQGSTTRNPEESTAIDAGTVSYTNQRIIFVGENVVREWDLDKIVNISADDNGFNLSIATSNREKASVLGATSMADITPGMAASLATTWQEKGKQAAYEEAKDMAARLRKALAEDQANKSS
jgi:hypothetical protein